MAKIFITTPIFYPNNKPHLGHAYTCTIADFLTRYYRCLGNEVFFSTGLDEHGQKIEKTAYTRGITPQAHVDEMCSVFTSMMQSLSIDYSTFIRTTQSTHKRAVKHFWKQLIDNNYIYLSKYSGWYSVSDEAFIKLEDINQASISNGKAVTTSGQNVIWLEEECYFFKLSSFTSVLLEYYQNNPDSIYPHSRVNEILGFLKQDLHDIAVSRTTITWGIKVPVMSEEIAQNALKKCINYVITLFHKNKASTHVIYVWIDALVNYLTVLGYPNIAPNMFKLWENSIHIIGKDILKFHAIYWPAFLTAAHLPSPTKILTHGWWLVDNNKMSKSSGNVTDPIELIAQYGSDELRWFFLRDMTFGEDAEFDVKQLHVRCNELANTIGNLVQRSISLLHKSHDGVIIDQQDVLSVSDFINTLDSCIKSYKLNQYAQHVLNFASQANKYFDIAQPWKDTDNSLQILSNMMYILKILGMALYPIMPVKALQILEALGINFNIMDVCKWNTAFLPAQTKITQLPILFKRYEL